MVNLSKFINWKPVLGEPQMIGEQVIRLQSQAISLLTPFGGFVWNRPTAVFVETEGSSHKLPIVDVTRYILLGIGVIALGGIMLTRLIRD